MITAKSDNLALSRDLSSVLVTIADVGVLEISIAHTLTKLALLMSLCRQRDCSPG